MAVVPTDEVPSVSAAPIPGQGIPRFDDRSSPAEFGFGIGNALERTGVRLGEEQKQEARRAEAEAKQAAEKAQREADQVRIAQANTTLSGYVTDQLYTNDKAAFKTQGADAVALDSKYLPGFDEQAAKISEGLANPEQKAAFAVHTAQQRSEMGLNLARYEKEAGDRSAQQTYQEAFNTAQSAAGLNWRGMADARTYADTKGGLVSMGEAAADRLKLGKKETTGSLVDGMISAVTNNALADNGIGNAARFLEAHKGELTNPALYATLKERIDAKQKQQEADLKDGLKQKLDDAVKGSLAGIPGSQNMISDRELQILYKHDWRQKRDFLDKAMVTGTVESKFDQMSPADIAADLSGSDPTKGPAHEGQGNDIELYNMRVAAAQRSITKRDADPRAFAIKQYADPQIDWTKAPDKAADIISNRAATAMDDSRRLGVNMPLLSKNEAAQLSGALAAMPPDVQLQRLAQMRDALGNESVFHGLLEQVRPNDPVIAEAALRLPRNPETAPLWYSAKYDNNPMVSQEILAGNALLYPKGDMKAEEGKGGIPKGVAMPTESQLRLAFNSHYPDEAFRGNPIAADQTYAAFRAVYAARVAKIGDTSGEVVNEAVKYAAKALAPNMDSHFAGSAVPVPPGMDPGTFPDRVNDAVSASLRSRGDNPALFKGHGLIQVGRLGSGDYVVLGADNQTLATYPGSNVPVRIHLDQQFAKNSTVQPRRAATRDFPQRRAVADNVPSYEADIPGAFPTPNPADSAPAVDRP